MCVSNDSHMAIEGQRDWEAGEIDKGGEGTLTQEERAEERKREG